MIPNLRLCRVSVDSGGTAGKIKPTTQTQTVKYSLPRLTTALCQRVLLLLIVLTGWPALVRPAHGEAMLQLFNMSWPDVTKKMPEIAEAG